MDSNQLDHSRTESQSTGSSITLSPSPQPSTFSQGVKCKTDSIPSYIPTEHPYRTLVLCFDGTGNQFSMDNSNIVEFFSLLKKDDPSKQLVYYQTGIGTYTSPQMATPLLAQFCQTVDFAIAWELDDHIMAGYEFLMQNYTAKDRICIFGFSRGAYTARCLAGMIHKVGLLPIYNHQQIPFAYQMYTTTDELGWKQSNAFKKTFCIDVDIEFLGVWDTVSSVGLISRRLPFTTSNTVVCTFRHALALDERRAKFKANLWNRPQEEEMLLSISEQKLAQAQQQPALESGECSTCIKQHHKSALRTLEERYQKDRHTPTDVVEVWFAGSHGDVGGGCVENGMKPCLARIPLRWMIRECFKTNSGILFNIEGMKDIGLDPASLYPVVLPRPPAIPIEPLSLNPQLCIAEVPKQKPKPTTTNEIPTTIQQVAPLQVQAQTEEEADLLDSLAPLHDQLVLKWIWWILEFTPMKHRFQRKDNKWISKWLGWNFGSGRYIPRHMSGGVRVHRSVKTRMDAEYKDGRKYWPKATLELKNVIWVD
ncbi:hypothetical protein BYT27DRAFT_7134432 [Phlegmacium glaucopus]|nr:hypothetical protein BYT27DRAFT_7134432 [Phlegmacium glaucopus]